MQYVVLHVLCLATLQALLCIVSLHFCHPASARQAERDLQSGVECRTGSDSVSAWTEHSTAVAGQGTPTAAMEAAHTRRYLQALLVPAHSSSSSSKKVPAPIGTPRGSISEGSSISSSSNSTATSETSETETEDKALRQTGDGAERVTDTLAAADDARRNGDQGAKNNSSANASIDISLNTTLASLNVSQSSAPSADSATSKTPTVQTIDVESR